MPALMNHDFFGKDLLGDDPHIIGDTDDDRDAFLLGCQGPDPLFYLATSPLHAKYWHLGTQMHVNFTAELFCALHKAQDIVSADEKDIAHAYAHGFICHYELDSIAHPLIYATQYKICGAGIKGLDDSAHSEVHAFIERELDESMLWRIRHQTVAEYAPYKHIIIAREHVLRIISKMFSYLALTVYGKQVPPDMYRLAIHKMRRTQHLFYSSTGMKRNVLGDIEQIVRRYSMLRSMAPRPVANPDPWVANEDHHEWDDPATGTPHFESFYDLYDMALEKAKKDIPLFDQPDFDLDAAHKLTGDINFNGEPSEAQIEVHEVKPLGSPENAQGAENARNFEGAYDSEDFEGDYDSGDTKGSNE